MSPACGALPGRGSCRDRRQAREALHIGGDGQWGGGRRGGDLPRDRHHGRVVCGRRRNCCFPRDHGAVRTGTCFGVRHPSRPTGTPPRPDPGRPGRRQTAPARSRELIGPGRTNGGWVSEGMASLPLPALSKFNSRMLKYVMKRFALKRGALMFGKMHAGRHRRHHRCDRQPSGRQEDRPQCALRRSVLRRRAGPSLCTCCRPFGMPAKRWLVTLANCGRSVSLYGSQMAGTRPPRV